MTPRTRSRLVVLVAVVATSGGFATVAAPAYSAPPDEPGTGQGNGPGNGSSNGPGDGPGSGQNGQTDKSPNDKADKPEPKPDTKPPAVPVLGTPTVEPKGVVTLTIRAEKGSQVLVKERQQVVAEGNGTGLAKTFTWTAKDGRHHYAVTATDKASNRSDRATVAVDIDAKAPKVRDFKVKAGNATDSRSTAVFTTEAGAAYRLLVGETVVASGTATKKPIRTVLDLPDGQHRVSVEVTDDVGNQRVANEGLKVKIPELKVSAKLLSEPTDAQQVVTVETTPNTKSVELRIPGEDSESVTMKRGSGKVTFALSDGTYDNARVVVEDSQGRSGVARLPEFAVDTTPPVLEVDGDDSAAKDGKLRFTVATDKGALVVWALVDPTGQQVAGGRFAATGSTETVTRDVDKGAYQLQVQATDIYDRTTDKELSARIASDPWPVWLLPVLVAAGVALAGILLLLLLRIGRRVGTKIRQSREARALRRGYTPRRMQMAEYKEAERRWRTRHEALSTLLKVADNGLHGLLALMPGVTLESEERLLFTTQALLLETGADGSTLQAADQGELVVTSMRFTFAGEQQRDWWLGKIEDMRHEGDDITMVKLSDMDTWSGFSYADPEVARLYLDLAWAEQQGERDAYVESVSRGLRDLELNRPTRPSRR